MTARRYKLSAGPIRRAGGRVILREIKEFTDDSDSGQVVVVVANGDAYDVRDALEDAYQNGREDRAGEEGTARCCHSPEGRMADNADGSGGR